MALMEMNVHILHCALANQKTPDGYYNIQRILESLTRRGEVATWGTYAEARGIGREMYIDGLKPGSMDLLGEWTL